MIVSFEQLGPEMLQCAFDESIQSVFYNSGSCMIYSDPWTLKVKNTIKFLNIGTDRSQQTVQTMIRLLL